MKQQLDPKHVLSASRLIQRVLDDVHNRASFYQDEFSEHLARSNDADSLSNVERIETNEYFRDLIVMMACIADQLANDGAELPIGRGPSSGVNYDKIADIGLTFDRFSFLTYEQLAVHMCAALVPADVVTVLRQTEGIEAVRKSVQDHLARYQVLNGFLDSKGVGAS